ncbi:MAG: sigma-54-dependent Fis family transcriptional regulator [Bacteroidetes bacterium]|nr:sigma-54-dependent Fis family transcriptional regulator [Bacteroidota bacterium]
MATILIIDDEEKLRGLLKRIITLEGYEVKEAGTIAAGWKQLETNSIDIVLCDVKLPDGNGVDFTQEVKAKYPYLEIVLLTAYGNIPDGVTAIKNGAFDYLVKGDDNDKIIPILSHVTEKLALQRRVKHLEKQLDNQYGFDNIIGNSKPLKEAIELAKKVAVTNTTVLLTGETGTGKEVFAQAIHYSSNRANNHFVALNCSAFSKELLESELFGHKAGAFTGAVKDTKGLIEEAKGGTLFLDEIGEMPIDLQPKILRLLENGTYIRVGDTKEQKADIRLIAATNRNLKQEVEQGHFRDDLYYRIAVFAIELPALRDRLADIPELASHYLKVYSSKTNKTIKSISKEALDILMLNEWKGNVRELKNVIERAVILEDSDALTSSSLPADMQKDKSNTKQGLSAFHLASVEKLHIQKVLNYTKGNKSEAARLMDIGLATLYRKIDEYGLK